MEPAIVAEHLTKEYLIGTIQQRNNTLRDAAAARIHGLVRSLAGRAEEESHEVRYVKALDDVSFEIAPGEVVGIIGRNGAGKSTLLKIVSRITRPTEGRAIIRGRIGSLLELGAGFHPELTGRQNVFLNGTVLGMRRAEITRKFDDIVGFAEIARFIDTPVKRYSSGMYTRLAFAVAAYLETETLVVDEVLAVGDAEFQQRCLGRMSEVSRDGRTVLFVSHNAQAVRRLCTRGLLFDRGALVDDGPVEPVMRRYLASFSGEEAGRRSWDDPAARPGNDLCRLREIRLGDELGDCTTSFLGSGPILVTIEFDVERIDQRLCVGFDLTTTDGTTVFRTHQAQLDEARRPTITAGRNSLTCAIPPAFLNSGRYVVNPRVWLVRSDSVVHEDAVLQFDVLADHGESGFLNIEERPGLVAPILDWRSAAVGLDDADRRSAAHG